MNLEERQKAARALENNKLLEEVFFDLETDFVKKWRMSTDSATREAEWFKAQALQIIRSRIDVAVSRALRGEQPKSDT